MIKEIPAHLLRPRILTHCQNPSSSAKIAQCQHQPHLVHAMHPRQPRTRRLKDRWSKEEEEKLLVQLWAEKHDFRKPKITRCLQHGVVFCSQILFLSATVAFLTNFLSLRDFKLDLSRTNLKLPSSVTWPL